MLNIKNKVMRDLNLIKTITLFILILSLQCSVIAQKNNHLAAYNTVENGMIFLGTAAITNIGVSSYQLISTDNNKDFHTMNIGWNGVNLILAGFGLRSNNKLKNSNMPAEDLKDYIRKQRNIVWINAGVDIGYVALGIWRRDKNVDQGNAIIYNGILLFAFDTLFGLALHNKFKKPFSQKFTFNLMPNGFAATYRL